MEQSDAREDVGHCLVHGWGFPNSSRAQVIAFVQGPRPLVHSPQTSNPPPPLPLMHSPQTSNPPPPLPLVHSPQTSNPPPPLPLSCPQDAYRRSAAMHAFLPPPPPSSSSASRLSYSPTSLALMSGASPAATTLALLAEQQPLEPALAALRDSIAEQLSALQQTADDLQGCLEVIGGGCRCGRLDEGMLPMCHLFSGSSSLQAATYVGWLSHSAPVTPLTAHACVLPTYPLYPKAMEARQQALRSGNGQPSMQVSSQQLYAAVNAQVGTRTCSMPRGGKPCCCAWDIPG